MKPSTPLLAAGLVGLTLAAAGPLAAQPKAPAPSPAASMPAPPQMPSSGMPMQPSIERVFEMLDTDHDGVVTLAEALKGVGEHFDVVDQNKDGSLDKAEFESWFGRANPEAAQFFLTLYDLDGDGKVTRAEFENPVKKRFALFDRNDDGKVTPEELAFARILMLGGPAGMLVPPMSAGASTAQPAPHAAMPQMPQSMPQMPQMPPQGMPQGMQPSQGQALPQFAPLGMPPVPQSASPAPGVYGPGGQMWNQPVGPIGPGGNAPYPGGNRSPYAPQGMPLR